MKRSSKTFDHGNIFFEISIFNLNLGRKIYIFNRNKCNINIIYFEDFSQIILYITYYECFIIEIIT